MTTRRPRRTARTLVGRRTAELDRWIGEQVLRLRLDAGVTQRALAEAAAIDQSYLSLLERGLREPSLTVLEAIALALGADLSVRLYPNTGPAIHDRIQGAILEALLAIAAPVWRRLTEVPVHRPARGVIDVVLHDPVARLVVAGEIESRIDRLEQQVRWANEKAESLPSAELWRFASEDGPPQTSRLLVVRSTRATRLLATRYAHVLASAYPGDSRLAYDALRGLGPWPGPSLLRADVTNGVATIRRSPPRGVDPGHGPG